MRSTSLGTVARLAYKGYVGVGSASLEIHIARGRAGVLLKAYFSHRYVRDDSLTNASIRVIWLNLLRFYFSSLLVDRTGLKMHVWVQRWKNISSIYEKSNNFYREFWAVISDMKLYDESSQNLNQ